jgi:hypothetical protein
MQCLVSDWKIKVTGRQVSPYQDTFIGQNQNIVEITETDGVYDVISCYKDYSQMTPDFAKALAEWLGLEEDGIAMRQQKPLPDEDPPEGPWMAMNASSPYPDIGGFNASQQREILSFYMANGWEAWAAENGINGEVKFTKYRFSSASNGDVLNMTRMVEKDWTPPWLNYTFSSLADLKEKEEGLEEEPKWLWNNGKNDYEKQGVLTVPFTRN